MKFTVIKSRKQYNDYCNILEKLLDKGEQKQNILDDIELLTLLIETWDSKHSTLNEMDPIELLHYLMSNHEMKARDLVNLLGVSKGLVSDILNYKKSLSKKIIRTLALYFKVSQEAFNRPYNLKNQPITKLNDSCVDHLVTVLN